MLLAVVGCADWEPDPQPSDCGDWTRRLVNVEDVSGRFQYGARALNGPTTPCMADPWFTDLEQFAISTVIEWSLTRDRLEAVDVDSGQVLSSVRVARWIQMDEHGCTEPETDLSAEERSHIDLDFSENLVTEPVPFPPAGYVDVVSSPARGSDPPTIRTDFDSVKFRTVYSVLQQHDCKTYSGPRDVGVVDRVFVDHNLTRLP